LFPTLINTEAGTREILVINTSFTENEPIVCTPEEAIDCFQRTRMDVLAIGPIVVTKRPVSGETIGNPDIKTASI
jgi:predicted NodU family carbamoyl transferase